MRRSLLATALAALSIAGCNTNAPAGAPAGGPVSIVVDADGFKPSTVSFKKGDKASLVFTRTTDETCAKEVVFPDLNLKKPLPKGQPVTIDVPTDKDRSLTFQCGMGMYKSSVVIAAK